MTLIPNHEELVSLLDGMYEIMLDEGILDELEKVPADELSREEKETLEHIRKVKQVLDDDTARTITELEEKLNAKYAKHDPAIGEYQQLQIDLGEDFNRVFAATNGEKKDD